MSNDIKQILKELDCVKRATESGTKTHALLAQVVIEENKTCGCPDLVKSILSVPGLAKFFGSKSKIEVPVAGFINGRFVSRRIDRLSIDEENKVVYILDYKTDTDRDTFIDMYRLQLQEYVKLVSQIYSDYKIQAFILWTHNWALERI